MLPFECDGTEIVTPYLANNVNATDTSFVAVSGWPNLRIVIWEEKERARQEKKLEVKKRKINIKLPSGDFLFYLQVVHDGLCDV